MQGSQLNRPHDQVKKRQAGLASQWAGGLRGLRPETQCAWSVSQTDADEIPLMTSPPFENQGPVSLFHPAPLLRVSMDTKDVGPAARQAHLATLHICSLGPRIHIQHT